MDQGEFRQTMVDAWKEASLDELLRMRSLLDGAIEKWQEENRRTKKRAETIVGKSSSLSCKRCGEHDLAFASFVDYRFGDRDVLGLIGTTHGDPDFIPWCCVCETIIKLDEVEGL